MNANKKIAELYERYVAAGHAVNRELLRMYPLGTTVLYRHGNGWRRGTSLCTVSDTGYLFVRCPDKADGSCGKVVSPHWKYLKRAEDVR